MKKWIWLLFALAFMSAYLILFIGNYNFVSDTGMLIILSLAIIGSARYGKQLLNRKI